MKSKSLIEISLQISSEAEEVVSIAFEEMFNQPPSIYVDEQTKRSTARIYLEKSQWSPAAQRRISERIASLRDTGIGIGKIKVKHLPAENWAESWKKHFKPIQVGKALLIKPSWSKLKPHKNQELVILDPGLSFGTGQHATTSFCLEQIVKCRRKGDQQSFLDIGTGSGILAIAAAKLGYRPVQAYDLDPESVRVSKENARINDVTDVVRPKKQDLTLTPIQTPKRFDLVCANLIYDLLIQEAERITNRVKPEGHLVLAGILKDQFPAVQEAFEARGFRLVRSRRKKEWQSGIFRPQTST